MLTAKLFFILMIGLLVSGGQVGDDCACNSKVKGECMLFADRKFCDGGMAEGCGCGEVGNKTPPIVISSDYL